MSIEFMRKLLFSIAGLTAFYLIFMFILHEDLTAPIRGWKKRLIPGLLMLIAGIFVSKLLVSPDLLHFFIPQQSWLDLLDIKSGFIRRALMDSVIPLIAASVFEISITAAQISLIDKLLFAWRGKRLPYSIALLALSGIAGTSAVTLFSIIMGSPDLMAQTTYILNQLSLVIGIILSTIFLLLIIINILNAVIPKKDRI
jgi:hypothetical protein